MNLTNGEQFPEIGGKSLDGNAVGIKEMLAGSWGVVLLYRGHW